MLSKILWICGAGIFVILGALHLGCTFFTRKFHPGNKDLTSGMKNTSPELTRRTTMWKAWVGFNASHSAGALFIGLINAILAIENFPVIENSFALSFLTIAAAVCYLWLAKRYWFSFPFSCLLVAVSCFMASIVISFFQ